MKDLILHAHTTTQFSRFIDNPSHAVLIHGAPGSGKQTLAAHLAAGVLGIDHTALQQYPYIHTIDAPAMSSDAIDAVRQLEKFLSLRVPAPGPINRIVIITDAQSLSHAAQNAL